MVDGQSLRMAVLATSSNQKKVSTPCHFSRSLPTRFPLKPGD
jgi:hypothetical protein